MRRTGMAVLLALCGLGLATPARAAAVPGGGVACAGTWSMHTVFSFDLVRPMPHSFEMTGPCGATGMLNGMCFGATGGGVLDDGSTFSLTWRGATLVFTGEAVGTLAIAADPAGGEDTCVGGDADDFVLTGALTIAP